MIPENRGKFSVVTFFPTLCKMHERVVANPIMTKARKPLPILVPILATFAALCGFSGCFFAATGSPELHSLDILLLSAVGLIAVAIAQWVLYFKGYINQQIEKRLQSGSGKLSN